jgi:hypothetical protein
MRIALLFIFAVLSASAQTNSIAPTNSPATFQTPTNSALSPAQRYEKVRMDCIQSRRMICGKIVKILPDGLVVESGYADLMRPPLNESWLIPGAATATRPPNVVEAKQPDAVCIGLVFLTDLPKGRGAQPKPQLYDYVNIEGFPVGDYTYVSLGDIHRTIRQFTTKLANATQWHLEQNEKESAPLK